MTTLDALAGLRILVVEDDRIVAMLIEEALLDQFCIVVGPFDRVADALEAARRGGFDAALLDVNVGGQTVFPVAEHLDDSGIPFLLLTGYGPDDVPGARPDWQACGKPFSTRALLVRLAERIASHRVGSRTDP